MRLVRKSCPDPMGSGKNHAHWSLRGKNFRASWSLWWDWDRKNFGCPIEVRISTPEKHYLIRPFSKSQAYDWNAGKFTGTREKNWDDIVWKHVVSSPQKNWDRFNSL